MTSQSLARADADSKLKSTEEAAKIRKQVSVSLSILIKHDLVECIFRTADTVPGKKETSFPSELTFSYVYLLKKQQCVVRLSMPRLLKQLFTTSADIKRASLLRQILISILANGSLFKQEIVQLMKRHGFKNEQEVEDAIVQLTLQHFIVGAQDNK